MPAHVHVIDAGDGASALLASAVAALASSEGGAVVAMGTTEGRAMAVRAGVRIDAWASLPCGLMRLAARPLARAVRAACSGEDPSAATCWSAHGDRAGELASCARRAFPRADVRAGAVTEAARQLACGHGDAAAASSMPAAVARLEMRASLGAQAQSLVVMGAADAPHLANTLRMLDVAGRAMLAGADAHLVIPSCMPQLVRTQRYAQGLGLEARLHVIDGAEWPLPWWRAADVILATQDAPLVEAVASAMGMQVMHAPGRASDESDPERRGDAAAMRDSVASALVDAARARGQSAMNESAASA